MKAFDQAGYLRVRTGLYLVATDPCGKPLGEWWQDHPPTRTPGQMLRINGIKVFTDGGSCGGVALSFELEPDWGFGDLWFDQNTLNDLLHEVHQAGYQLAVHAIGDRAVVQALNAYEFILEGQPNRLGHRMAHSIGLALFGGANLHRRELPRANWVPLAAGLLGGPIPFLLSSFLPEDSDLPFVILIGAQGLGWLLLGGLIALAHLPAEQDQGPGDSGETKRKARKK
jgi:hypothetical protein